MVAGQLRRRIFLRYRFLHFSGKIREKKQNYAKITAKNRFVYVRFNVVFGDTRRL